MIEEYKSRLEFNRKYQKIDAHKFDCVYCLEVKNTSRTDINICKLGVSKSIRDRIDRLQSHMNKTDKGTFIARIMLIKGLLYEDEQLIHQYFHQHRLVVMGQRKFKLSPHIAEILGNFRGDTELFLGKYEYYRKYLTSSMCQLNDLK